MRLKNTTLQNGFDTVHGNHDSSADAHYADLALRDAVVESPNANAQSLGSFCFRKRRGRNYLGVLGLLQDWRRPGRNGSFDFLPDRRLNCCKKGFREFVQGEDLAVLIDLKDKFQGHGRSPVSDQAEGFRVPQAPETEPGFS